MIEATSDNLLTSRAQELLDLAQAEYESFHYGSAYDTYVEAIAVIQEHGEASPELNFKLADCMVGMDEHQGAVKFLSDMIKVYAEDPLIVSRCYYERGKIRYDNLESIDSLVDFHLAREHLVGAYAPRHHKLGKALTKTLALIAGSEEDARQQLYMMPIDGRD